MQHKSLCTCVLSIKIASKKQPLCQMFALPPRTRHRPELDKGDISMINIYSDQPYENMFPVLLAILYVKANSLYYT